MNYIYHSDNLPVLESLKNETIDLVYIDPPFNTGKSQRRTQVRVKQSENGDRIGFQGQRYETVNLGTQEYSDNLGDDFLAFMEPRLSEAHRILKSHGTLYFHIDYREVHYCKLLLDSIFGKECFVNEIIWAYDYGGKSKTRWPAKHDNILVYVKDPDRYYFNGFGVDRLLGDERDEPWRVSSSDVWWHTIVPTNGKEKTGYPTQKPRGIVEPIILASSKRGDVVLDFFAGSGTTGDCCLTLARKFILIDDNKQAIDVMRKRFHNERSIKWNKVTPHMYENSSSNLWAHQSARKMASS